MATKRILCVGLCNLDIIQICERFPEEDSDQRSLRSRWQRGGNASNNCTILALLGADCELLATFAATNDHFRGFAIGDLERRGIATGNCVHHQDTSYEVPLSTVWLSTATGSRTIVHSNPNLPELTAEDFGRCDLGRYSWVHFEGRRTASEIAKMIASIKQWNDRDSNEEVQKIVISVDLEKPRDSNLLLVPNADFIFLGKDFARFRGYNSAEEAVKGFKEEFPGSYSIICPWGSHDIAALSSSGQLLTCGVYPPPEGVRDTLGAGDTFCAGCIFVLNRDGSLQAAIEFGSKLAGAKVGDFGFDHLAGKISSLLE